MEVSGLGLSEQEIHETSTPFRGSLNQLQIFGAEDHCPEQSKIIFQTFDRLLVHTQAALL